MTGNVRWNLYGGAAAFAVTCLVSLSRNVLSTTLLRGVYSFLLVFVLIFLFRFVLHMILNVSGAAHPEAAHDDRAVSDTGQNVDLATPNDESLQDLLRSNLHIGESAKDDTPFAPLKPPKLLSQSGLDPEELANALRRMSEE